MTPARLTLLLKLAALFGRGERIVFWMAILGAALLSNHAVWSQPNAGLESNEPTSSPPHPSQPIQYVGPDTFILLDAQGRPQPILGMTYEDFLKSWKASRQPAAEAAQPRFTIETMKADGHAHEQSADLNIEFTVHLLGDGNTNVPLGLVGAILQGDAKFTVGGGSKLPAANAPDRSPANHDEYLDFNSQNGGYVAHLTGKAGERRVVSLHLIVPLQHDGAKTVLAINCPQAVSSTLNCDFDSQVTDVRSSSGTITSNELTPEHQSRLHVAGAAGEFRLSWQPASATPAFSSVLNAIGAIHISIDGRGIRSDARLTVQSYGGTFDQFRVRLPVGAKLVRTRSSEEPIEGKYRVTEEIPPKGTPTNASAAQTVLIDLKDRQYGPVVVNLSTEQVGKGPNDTLDLAGFEVIGAVRQYGDIGLNVANDWQARWNIGHDVRQVDPNEIDSSLQRPDLSAAFQYDHQPWSLSVRVSPRVSRIHVSPQYDLELLPDEARLNVRLGYQNFGARAFELRLDLSGWELSGEPIESGGLVDQDQITVSSKGILILPLAQPLLRKAEIALSLKRSLDRDTGKLSINLPVPMADSVAAGELSVRTPAETELLADLAASNGISISTARDANTSPTNDGRLTQLFRLQFPSPIFVAHRSNRKREQTVQSTSQVSVGPEAIQIEQRLNFVVRYEAVQELQFDTTGDLPTDDSTINLEVISSPAGTTGANEQLTPLSCEIISDEQTSSAADLHRLRARLPQPRTGSFVVVARCRIPRLKSALQLESLHIPILIPADTQIGSLVASVDAPTGISVALPPSRDGFSWRNGEQTAGKAGRSIYEFVSDRAESVLPLALSTANRNGMSNTIVDRIWLQTWLSGRTEQDRIAYRLRSARNQVAIELPPDISLESVEVLVDGHVAEVIAHPAGRIVARLLRDNLNPTNSVLEPVDHTLELRYRRVLEPSLINRQRITPPQIDGVTDLSQVYWQIVLPGDEHIIQSPDQLVATSQWQWLGSFWGRQPSLSQADLEKWTGASQQLAPSDSASQYLFSGLFPVSTIVFVTAPRWLIVLISSTATLIVFVGLICLPGTKKIWTLVVVTCVIASLATAYPTAAFLLAQASALGIVLVPITMILSKSVPFSRRARLSTAISPALPKPLTTRSDSIAIPPVLATSSTAPTVTIRVPDSER